MKLFDFKQIKKRVLAITTAFAVGVTGATVAQTTQYTVEELVWSYVEQIGSADAYAAYLAENPNGQFADAARAMLAEMAENGVEPSPNVAGFDVANVDQNLAAFIADRGLPGLSDYFTISYAG